MASVVPPSSTDRVASSISKAEAHAAELQDMISLSAGSGRIAYKKALLIRLELQYSLSMLRLEHGAPPTAARMNERTIDLERALVRLSSHVSKARTLWGEKAYPQCAAELYAADALAGKIIPRLKREVKGEGS